jgi:catechol 2,3-dioxygenase-like lactoylglutathione lyase family enzyme
MFDHIGMQVSNLEASKAFYARALKPLGYEIVMEFGKEHIGFGMEGKPGVREQYELLRRLCPGPRRE